MTIPLGLLVPWQKEHYFDPTAPRINFRCRAHTFWGDTALFPLVHAFLDACASDQPDDYRYVFNLLGSELAANAIRHSLSGDPGGTYTLRVDRSATGMTVTCRDAGIPVDRPWDIRNRRYLSPDPNALNPEVDAGRGLALIDLLSTSWGDNGMVTHRHVWFHLDYDMSDNAWSTA
ncbi:ATP-binding protein [Streptomonospora sp. S1-112]|uniref:ATP-binding protein n=1 Tax=Streptomonospora mangrovi TaxID=2883123 RepID=A0A9X3NT13_9ACTN|nr:ATP-binding protein [Streptomonospora mangrovi]MDA0563646.1 ATP-binding protein [Streptomonospora mangrovi]